MVPNKKLELLKKNAQKSCDNCNGEGCSICASRKDRMNQYAKAGIPILYWDLAFKDFKGDARFAEQVKEILVNMDSFYDLGESIAFIGNLGTGKTYAACCILKIALLSKFSCMYLNMSDIIDRTTNNDKHFLEEITEVDILCVDEFDLRWVYPSEKAEQLFGQTMERILRIRFQNKMPTIICSNTLELKNVLGANFSPSIDSLFSKYVKSFFVVGKDFRKLKVKNA